MENKTISEWLYNHLFPNQLDGFSDEEWNKIDKAFEQAKQMELKKNISDDEIIESAIKYYEPELKSIIQAYIEGAKWMRNKIKNQI